MIHLEPDSPAGPKRKPNWTTIGLLGSLALLIMMLVYFTTRNDPDQDKLSDSEVTTSQAPADGPERVCASKATYDLVKRELFRSAAQRRGSDAAAYDRLAAFAVARMENPVMESEPGASQAQCSGTLSLDLPPGVVAEGGRRTLMSAIDYSVQPAADGTGNAVRVSNAEAIIGPLATLARAASAAPQATQPEPDGLTETNDIAPSVAAPPPAAPPPAAAPPQVSARPSFDCGRARTRGEIAVCGDAGLATLDRQMAGQFNRALGQADAQQRFLLLRTRAEFLEFRDNCRGDQCIANAYSGRMREIGDIMAGRWRQR